MRLLSLRLQNFRVLKKASIFFPDKVIGVIGPNGAGKSSLVEAISWALYGNQVARSGKDEIKSAFADPREPCEACLEFAVNGERYRVVRRLAGRLERPEVELYRGETSESVGVNETRKYVGELLGLDWRGFLTSFLARQQELNALSDLQPAKRRDQLAAMLGIDRLDQALQQVREDSRAAERQALFLDRQLTGVTSVQQRIDELVECKAELTQRLDRLQRSLRTAEAAYRSASEANEAAQRDRMTWLEIQAKREAAQRTATHLKEHLAVLRREAAKLAHSLKEVELLEPKLSKLPEIRRRLEELGHSKARLELRQTWVREQSDLNQQIRETESEADEVRNLVSVCREELMAIPHDIEERLQASQTQLERARDGYSRCREESAALESDRDRLQQQMGSMAELGPESICDRCLRPFGDSLPEIRTHLEGEKSRLEVLLAESGKRLSLLSDQGKELRDQCRSLESQAKRRYELTVKCRAMQAQQQMLTTRLGQLQGRLSDVSAKLKAQAPVRFDERQYAALAARTEELVRDQSRSDRLKGELLRLPTVEQAIAENTGKLDVALNEASCWEAEQATLEFSEESFAAKQQSFQDAQESLESARADHVAVEKERALNRKELEEKREQMRQFERTDQELERCRDDHYYAEKLTTLLSDFRSVLIARIRPTLSEIASRLIAEMTDGRYGLVELDDKYRLQLMDYRQYFGIDRFSGGEKDLANLCLRLAISLALTESAGLKRSFVILDEVFGSQDNERKELIVKALATLKHRFPQILLITHVEDIRDRVEELIEIVPTGDGWSEVRVNGTPAA